MQLRSTTVTTAATARAFKPALMAGVMILAATQACDVLGFAVLTDAVSTLGAVLAHLATAAMILACGLWLASAAARAVESQARVNAPVLAKLTRAAILFFTAALALRQAGLPAEIITIAFASVVGAIALAAAIAVGMGGRHVAGRLLESAVQSFQVKEAAPPTTVAPAKPQEPSVD